MPDKSMSAFQVSETTSSQLECSYTITNVGTTDLYGRYTISTRAQEFTLLISPHCRPPGTEWVTTNDHNVPGPGCGIEAYEVTVCVVASEDNDVACESLRQSVAWSLIRKAIGKLILVWVWTFIPLFLGSTFLAIFTNDQSMSLLRLTMKAMAVITIAIIALSPLLLQLAKLRLINRLRKEPFEAVLTKQRAIKYALLGGIQSRLNARVRVLKIRLKNPPHSEGSYFLKELRHLYPPKSKIVEWRPETHDAMTYFLFGLKQ
jgi:hypothetical protein